ncbi:MAG: sigma 54-interacting transcriptional regulator [Deltaproteobacteria bacterium]
MPVTREDLPLTTAHLAYLLDTCGDGFIVCDADQAIVLVNKEAERIFGYEEGELLGASIQQLMPDRHRPRHHAGFEKRLKNPAGMPIRYVEVEALHKSGSELPIEIRFTYTPLGGELYFTGSVRDVSQQVAARKTLERQAAEIERLNEELARERDYLREEVHAGFDAIIGESPALKMVLAQIDAVAQTEVTVLIQGESGVGKELFARAIHERSARRGKPLIRVNCASVPKELFESEFFGHVKGAFTGAHQAREGRFGLAHGGTIFLDEIGEVPLELQSKLLRVLQEHEFERVGDDRTQKVDVRVIAATNRDLLAEVAEGRFREDLYYRLGVFPLRAPPLRERGEDVTQIAEHFLARAASKLHVPRATLAEETLRVMLAYRWPGNVRELQNVMERASILARGKPIVPEMLGLPGAQVTFAAPVEEKVAPTRRRSGKLTEADIRAALKKHDGIVLRAAKELGVSRQALYRRIEKLGIQ